MNGGPSDSNRQRKTNNDQGQNENLPARRSGSFCGDILGYSVSYQPQSRNRAQYYVKFTPIPGVNRTQVREQVDANTPGPSSHAQNSGQCPPLVQNSSETVEDLIFDTILNIIQEVGNIRSSRPRGSNRIRQRPARRTSRSRNARAHAGRLRTRIGRRGRRHSTDSDSEATMYEVVDVNYEKISDLKAPPQMNWRIVPRYELTDRETTKQERELYFLMTSESKHEDVVKPRLGEPICCICHENAATRVVIPCGHRCLCHPCAYYIATNRSMLGTTKIAKKCPMCQAAIGLLSRLR